MAANKDDSRISDRLRRSSFVRWTLFSLGSFCGVLALTTLCAEVLMLPENWAFLPPVIILFFWNFITMRYFVYGRPIVPLVEQFTKYAGTAVAFRSLDFLAYWLLVTQLGVRYILAVIFVMPVSFVAKFLFYKSHVFTSQPFHQARSTTLSRQDIETLAKLHGEALPDSTITRMGPAYVRSFYQYVVRSKSELLLTRRREGRICAACVVSLAPKHLSTRLLTETPLALTLVIRAPSLLMETFKRHNRATPSANTAKAGEIARIGRIPELLLIFSSPHVRGEGLGAELLHECESELMRRGFDQYSLKTIEGDSNRAIRFYQREGLHKQYSVQKHGRLFSVFTKILTHSPLEPEKT